MQERKYMLDLILKRRSVRQYLKKEVEETVLKDILSAGLLAPTGMNKKPCRFYVIKKKEILEALSTVKPAGAAMLKEASVAIAVVVDEERTDTLVEDSSIALSFMQLEAADKNLGSCWVQIRLRTNEGKSSESEVQKLFNLSDKDRVVGILALGYPEKEVKVHSVEEIDWSKVQEV